LDTPRRDGSNGGLLVVIGLVRDEKIGKARGDEHSNGGGIVKFPQRNRVKGGAINQADW
jgi:hypothetical protein